MRNDSDGKVLVSDRTSTIIALCYMGDEYVFSFVGAEQAGVCNALWEVHSIGFVVGAVRFEIVLDEALEVVASHDEDAHAWTPRHFQAGSGWSWLPGSSTIPAG